MPDERLSGRLSEDGEQTRRKRKLMPDELLIERRSCKGEKANFWPQNWLKNDLTNSCEIWTTITRSALSLLNANAKFTTTLNLVLMSTLKKLPASNLPLDAMRAPLAPPPDLPLALIAHYSYPCQFLEGMLLSPKGIQNDSDLDNPQVNVCDSCYKSLTSSSVRGPPKFAIANGLFMGVLPVEFHDLTRTELSMTALAQSSHCISAIHGGSHKKLKSHSYAFAKNRKYLLDTFE